MEGPETSSALSSEAEDGQQEFSELCPREMKLREKVSLSLFLALCHRDGKKNEKNPCEEEEKHHPPDLALIYRKARPLDICLVSPSYR